MLSAPSVLQTLYLHYFPLRDLIAFYLTLDISCEIQWLHFQYESIHCLRDRMARANSTLQTRIQKASHMSRYRWKCLRQMRTAFFIMQMISKVSGFCFFLETCTLSVKSSFSPSTLSPLYREFIFSSISFTVIWLSCEDDVSLQEKSDKPWCHLHELNHHSEPLCSDTSALVWALYT